MEVLLFQSIHEDGPERINTCVFGIASVKPSTLKETAPEK